MAKLSPQSGIDDLTIRTYCHDRDREVVRDLYENGLLAGQLAPNDTGADIDDIPRTYFEQASNHFWVATLEGRVVGMIGLALEGEHTGEIRRLRVLPNWQGSGVAGRLIESALAHCNQHGYVKVVFDTRFERDDTVDLFERFGFQHTRTKAMHGKELLEFYLNLYRQTKPGPSPA